jgi:hypothetical protein
MKRRETPLVKVPLVIPGKQGFGRLWRDHVILPTLMLTLPGRPPGVRDCRRQRLVPMDSDLSSCVPAGSETDRVAARSTASSRVLPGQRETHIGNDVARAALRIRDSTGIDPLVRRKRETSIASLPDRRIGREQMDRCGGASRCRKVRRSNCSDAIVEAVLWKTRGAERQWQG